MNHSNSATTSGRRRGMVNKQHSVEDQALDQIAQEAEARLAANRAARAEARDIRMKEIERQQKEEERQERDTSSDTSSTRLQGDSRRSSFDSIDSVETPKDVSKELKLHLRDMEEKYKKAMMTNAQLDNEKHTLMYQVELLKDQIEEQEEGYVELQREYKDKCRTLDLKLRDLKNLETDLTGLKQVLADKEQLIQESGMVVVSTEEGSSSLEKGAVPTNGLILSSSSVLLSQDVANMLEKAGEGSLDDKLKRFASERQKLIQEVKRLKEELDDEKYKKNHTSPNIPNINGPEMQLYEVQREASKQIHEYKLKLQKAEQDIATLEGTVNRLETQVKRYRTETETSERLEDELKTEKRRLQRELREAQNHIEELQNSNKHLQKRLEKMKQARNALVNQ